MNEVLQAVLVIALSVAMGAGLVWALMWVTKREAEFDAQRAERRKRERN